MAEFKNELDGDKSSLKKVRSPWNFNAPSYDNRSGPAISAGSNYGVGVRQNVGEEDASGDFAVPLRSKCFSPNDVV